MDDKTSRFPFRATPNSWFHLLWSDDVARERFLHVRAFETELIAFRGRDGAVTVLDAHCHHHGVATQGRLVGEHFCCPVDGLVFDRAGRCVGGARRSTAAGGVSGPAGAPSLRRWEVREQDGMILVHHDVEGRAPSFEVPHIPECSSDRWLPVGRIEWTVRSHIQELVENSVDLAHFALLHNFTELARLVHYQSQPHTFSVTIAAPKLVFGRPRPTELTIEYHGMGVALGRVTRPFPFLNVVTNLPVDSEHMRLRFNLFVKAPRVPVLRHVMAAGLRWHVRHDVEEELRVLEHKRYLERPALAAGDGPIMSVRRWCQQFYDLAADREAPMTSAG